MKQVMEGKEKEEEKRREKWEEEESGEERRREEKKQKEKRREEMRGGEIPLLKASFQYVFQVDNTSVMSGVGQLPTAKATPPTTGLLLLS